MKFSAGLLFFFQMAAAVNVNLRNGNGRILQDSNSSSLKLGANVMLTGPESSSYASAFTNTKELWLSEIQADGGITVGGTTFPVELVVLDNENDIDKATSNQGDLSDQGVLASIGPYWSSRAIPAAEVANEMKTTMISPSSTNPDTTLNKPYVYRAAALDSLSAPLIARFVSTSYGFTKAAIIYQCNDAFTVGAAEYFKTAWEKNYGEVLVYECIDNTDGNTTSLQESASGAMTKVVDSEAEFMFLSTFSEIGFAMIKAAAANAAWTGDDSTSESRQPQLKAKLIVTVDAALEDDVGFANCGPSCEGVVALQHYAPGSDNEAAKAFEASYADMFNGTVPDDTEALTYDSFNLLKNAIMNCGSITGDISTDRECVNEAMANTTDFPGVTGSITFDKNGDPMKCVQMVMVENSTLAPLQESCPTDV
jgi:branched-chain amino acid transport system substrate-binding protein